jgi:hypothetical protein
VLLFSWEGREKDESSAGVSASASDLAKMQLTKQISIIGSFSPLLTLLLLPPLVVATGTRDAAADDE